MKLEDLEMMFGTRSEVWFVCLIISALPTRSSSLSAVDFSSAVKKERKVRGYIFSVQKDTTHTNRTISEFRDLVQLC